MSLMYADENFPYVTVEELRRLGHDVLTAHEAGQANQKIPDSAVLAFSSQLGRAVLTNNRRHFINLHRKFPTHGGIIVCTEDDDSAALARGIHQAIAPLDSLADRLVRINKPAQP